MKKNNIVLFNIDREQYGLPPLRATDCINCIGTIKHIKRNRVRISFIDIFATNQNDVKRHTITIDSNRIIEVI